MQIHLSEEKQFTQDQVESLFLSVGWVSGKYPDRLYKALMNSSTVITAWSGNNLVGLLRALDDTEMLAFVHYVLVHPDFQGQGIAKTMVEQIKEKYRNYLYIALMPEDAKNVAFYQKLGFEIMPDGTPMIRCNFV